MAIGWLEREHSYTKGIASAELLDRLKFLRKRMGAGFPAITFRGKHVCTLCTERPNETMAQRAIDQSHINIFVPTTGFVYVSPGGIDHYIEVHGYEPPESFTNAVLECPDPSSDEFRKMLASANRGYEAPIFKSRG